MYNNLSKYAFDPHQYQRFKEKDINMISNPYLPPGDNRTKETIIQQIRNFASTFHSKHSAIWSWYKNGYDEVNCHTFLFLLLGELKLADVIIRDNKDIHFRKYLIALLNSKKADETRKTLLNDLETLSSEIPAEYNWLMIIARLRVAYENSIFKKNTPVYFNKFILFNFGDGYEQR